MYRLLLLFFCGNFKEFKTNLNYAINKRLNKYRVIKIFESLSKKLISDQKDYRLIVYKNFDYNYSKFREIFKKYGSNKGGEWAQRNNIIRHFYADLYEDILANKDIKNLDHKILVIVMITAFVFIGRNASRLVKEYKIYSYNPFINVNYPIKEGKGGSFRIQKRIEKIINEKKAKKIYKNRYIVF